MINYINKPSPNRPGGTGSSPVGDRRGDPTFEVGLLLLRAACRGVALHLDEAGQVSRSGPGELPAPLVAELRAKAPELAALLSDEPSALDAMRASIPAMREHPPAEGPGGAWSVPPDVDGYVAEVLALGSFVARTTWSQVLMVAGAFVASLGGGR